MNTWSYAFFKITKTNMYSSPVDFTIFQFVKRKSIMIEKTISISNNYSRCDVMCKQSTSTLTGSFPLASRRACNRRIWRVFVLCACEWCECVAANSLSAEIVCRTLDKRRFCLKRERRWNGINNVLKRPCQNSKGAIEKAA